MSVFDDIRRAKTGIAAVNQMAAAALQFRTHAMRSIFSMINVKTCSLLAGLLTAMLSPCIAGAALGEPEASVQTDGVQMHGSIKISGHGAYRQHEIALPSGTLVREFAAADGTVFAVAWNGPTMPNLRQTLGRYFDTYVSAARSAHTGHSRLQIQQDGLVVQSGGHMRAFAGRAYLTQAIPAGVSLGDVH